MEGLSFGLDIQTIIDLEPEEFAAKLLFLIRLRCERDGEYRPRHDDLQRESHEYISGANHNHPPYLWHQYNRAFSEAFSWLEVQGLLVQDRDQRRGSGITVTGFRQLSRRAARFVDEVELLNWVVARRLPRDSLHPSIAQSVWSAFIRGEYDVAVFKAAKAVEIAVRDASGLDEEYGDNLIKAAFAAKGGPLTDMSATFVERSGLMFLFAGFNAAYRNPHAHRNVALTDPAEAIEIVIIANHLLRIVEARRSARNRL